MYDSSLVTFCARSWSFHRSGSAAICFFTHDDCQPKDSFFPLTLASTPATSA